MPKTRFVALIVDTTRAYHRKMVPGVADYVREAGNWRLYVEEGPQDRLPDFRVWKGDGILSTIENSHIRESLSSLSIPVVVLERIGLEDWSPQIPSVGTNNRAIGELGAKYLLDLGFQQLAFCGYPKSKLSGWSVARAKAFADTAREAGCPCSLYTGRYHFTKKWAEMLRDIGAWLEKLPKPLGLMAGNDARARHVMEACRTVGLRVPEDVAVIGVDNDEILCEVTQPKLTSIEQGSRRIGYLAAAMLDRMMAGKKPKKRAAIVAPEGIVARQSTEVLAIDEPDVAAAVRYVRENACQGMQIEDLVRHVGLSRSSLENKFKDRLGRTIHAEIRRVQLEKAKELVLHSELSLKQIAARSGFTHIQHMTNVFRETLGCPPGEYRNQWKR